MGLSDGSSRGWLKGPNDVLQAILSISHLQAGKLGTESIPEAICVLGNMLNDFIALSLSKRHTTRDGARYGVH
jgi:hypothetical protein